jgi:hypothetical protein
VYRVPEFNIDYYEIHAAGQAKADLMNTINERRRHARLCQDDQFYIQVLAASESPDMVGLTMRCSTVDVSPAGIKLDVEQEVPVSSEIDLWIEIRPRPRRFFLRGMVKWCYDADAENHVYQIGVQLLDANSTDYEDWCRMFDEIDDTCRLDRR